jgi:hypothetical protein
MRQGAVEQGGGRARLAFVLHIIAFVVLAGAGFFAPVAASAYIDEGPSPDLAAWEVFTQILAPSGAPAERRLEFETWASDDDIYLQSPPRWPDIGVGSKPAQCRQDYDREAAASAGLPDDACILEEVRRNWAAYRYIVANDLYSRQGLAKAFQQHLKIELPTDSVQVKADWMRIGDVAKWLNLEDDAVRRIYFTKIAGEDSAKTEYALISLHLNSKRWKNWLWATFEHRMNPGRCDDLGCHDSFGAASPDVGPKTQANQNYGACAKSVALMGLFANAGLSPVWLNYCLKGAQIDFAEKDGRPTLLGNSVIDRINGHIAPTQSSCITCHALASFNSAGEPSDSRPLGAIGRVDAARLQGYLTSNFVWGVAKAK